MEGWSKAKVSVSPGWASVCARVSLDTRKGTWVEVCVSSRMILQWEGPSLWPAAVPVAAGGLLRMGKGREGNMGEFPIRAHFYLTWTMNLPRNVALGGIICSRQNTGPTP